MPMRQIEGVRSVTMGLNGFGQPSSRRSAGVSFYIGHMGYGITVSITGAVTRHEPPGHRRCLPKTVRNSFTKLSTHPHGDIPSAYP